MGKRARRIIEALRNCCSADGCEGCPSFEWCHSPSSKNKGDSLDEVATVMIEALSAKLERVPKWVSTNDRLPEKEENVLVIVNGKPRDNVKFIDAYMLATYYKPDWWCIEGYEGWENPVINWWMPLPEEPWREKHV